MRSGISLLLILVILLSVVSHTGAEGDRDSDPQKLFYTREVSDVPNHNADARYRLRSGRCTIHRIARADRRSAGGAQAHT